MSDEGYTFDWHKLDDHNPEKIDHFLKWLVPTVLADSGVADEIAEESDQYTRVELTMQLNGIEVDARAFVEGCYRNMRLFAQDAAVAKLVEVVDYANLVETIEQLRVTLRGVALQVARDLGVDRGLEDLGVDE